MDIVRINETQLSSQKLYVFDRNCKRPNMTVGEALALAEKAYSEGRLIDADRLIAIANMLAEEVFAATPATE